MMMMTVTIFGSVILFYRCICPWNPGLHMWHIWPWNPVLCVKHIWPWNPVLCVKHIWSWNPVLCVRHLAMELCFTGAFGHGILFYRRSRFCYGILFL